jgi:hypothetical protein
MIVGNFNYHQILFAIDSFNNFEDKLGYLDKIEKELKRIIACFDTPRSLPLKMYASKNISIGNNCEELKEFIKSQFEIATSNPYDTRYPGEGALRGLVRNELMNYSKLLSIIQDEKSGIINNYSGKGSNEISKTDKYINLVKKSPHYVAKTLSSNTGKKIIWNDSIGELIDLMKIIVILELIPELHESNLSRFISKNFVDIKKDKFSLAQIEKVFSMLQNTFWQNGRTADPRYFQ